MAVDTDITAVPKDPLLVSALGATIAVDFNDDADPDTIAAARACWSGAVTEHAVADRTVTLPRGEQAPVLERLSVMVTLAALEANRGSELMFHAGAVAADSGNVVAYVGPSGRGKTTLSRALGTTFGYVSDESVAVNLERRVLPYRKPLSIVQPDAPKAQLSPADAGLRDLPPAALTMVALLLLERDTEHGEPRITPVHPADAIPLLVTQMSYLADLDRPLVELCTLLETVGGVRQLSYREAESVVPLVTTLIAAEPTPLHGTFTPVAADLLPAGVADAVIIDDIVIVLAGTSLQVLDGIAPEVWLRTIASEDIDTITAAAVERYGTPPNGDARALVLAVQDELRASSLLTDTGNE